MNPVVDSGKLERIHVSGEGDTTVRWTGAFASCGGRGANQSSTIVYEIEPGGRLGWHTDATEETQYIIAGSGELRMESGNYPLRPGSVFVFRPMSGTIWPTPARRPCVRLRSLRRPCSRRLSTM